jgi:PKD domain
MALRRGLRCAGVAIALVLAFGAAPALAAPQWLPAEPRDSSGSADQPADVATDGDGNSVAVWLGSSGAVNAAFRPRGGPWGAAEDLDPGATLSGSAPRVAVQPDGEFVAVWLEGPGSGTGYPLRWARRPAGAGWSSPATITSIGCCPGIEALEASADGSVTVVSSDEGSPTSYTKPPGSETWGPGDFVPTGSGSRYAFAPDGSALAVGENLCGPDPAVDCLQASYHPPGGPWGAIVPVANVTPGAGITGFEVAATPSSGYTVMWGESVIGDSTFDPPGRVRSSDRGAGVGGAWDASLLVADLPDDAPGCDFFGNCFDLAVGGDGTQLAVWEQTGAAGARVSAALRPSGGPWGAAEKAGDTGSSGAPPFATITTDGIPAVAWGSAGSGSAKAHLSHRGADGAWNPVDRGSGAEGTVYLGDIAADGDGNALTAWKDPDGVFTAGFDGSGPRFDSFSAPATGTVGATLPFAATADDNWSGLSTIAWLFGDGGTAVGGEVNHAYTAAGAFTATATATDGIGNTSQASGPVSVTAVATPSPTPTPTPNPCGTTDRDRDNINDGCDTSDGAKRPVPFKTVNATVVSGDVFVKLPAGAARAAAAKPPKGFVRLQGAQTIPVGSTLDTAKGRVLLRSAADTRRHLQHGQFFRGRFVIRQVRQPRGKAKRRSTKLITVLTLSGSSFSKRCRTTTASASAKRRSKKRVRRLFGSAKGSFRTTGRTAAATVRGTRWGVQDRCDGTLISVQRGRVSVRDLVKHRTVSVTTGHTYLARRR